jgi:hypothetical protein
LRLAYCRPDSLLGHAGIAYFFDQVCPVHTVLSGICFAKSTASCLAFLTQS